MWLTNRDGSAGAMTLFEDFADPYDTLRRFLPHEWTVPRKVQPLKTRYPIAGRTAGAFPPMRPEAVRASADSGRGFGHHRLQIPQLDLLYPQHHVLPFELVTSRWIVPGVVI